ncbi:MAG TPA: hypothetical protein VFP95_03090, partial [Gammaproteobacteria bacterium]|nr:hypothetical protein [Gammaproteobacteria bacterium]
GSGETLVRHKRGHFKDVNNDGFTDLVLHFPTQPSGIRCGDGVVFLKGATFTDIPLQGFDSIQPVSCK